LYFGQNDKNMNLIYKILFLFLILFMTQCANYENVKKTQEIDKKYYSSIGFALIYDDILFDQGILNKKINNNEIVVLHSFLKKNTPVKLINPDNLMSIDVKVYKNANYPKIFNVVISKKISTILGLDPDNPYIEVIEYKRNKTFIAKESNIYDEEKNVALKVPVNEIIVDDLSKKKIKTQKNSFKKTTFILVIADFYYFDSANNLKKQLINQTENSNFIVKKINNNKYRLYVGPFKNFNTLKSTYISLNNLGFENLNVYKK